MEARMITRLDTIAVRMIVSLNHVSVKAYSHYQLLFKMRVPKDC